jgi:tRNA G37 N-methylase TrmD
LSGDHGAIARWRAEQSYERTRQRRADLLDRRLHIPDESTLDSGSPNRDMPGGP